MKAFCSYMTGDDARKIKQIVILLLITEICGFIRIIVKVIKSLQNHKSLMAKPIKGKKVNVSMVGKIR